MVHFEDPLDILGMEQRGLVEYEDLDIFPHFAALDQAGRLDSAPDGDREAAAAEAAEEAIAGLADGCSTDAAAVPPEKDTAAAAVAGPWSAHPKLKTP